MDVKPFVSKSERSAQENLFDLIQFAKFKLNVLVPSVDFDANCWDVTKSIPVKGTRGKRRLHFSLEGTNRRGVVRTLMPEPFMSFAKSYLRYQHAMRPTTNICGRMTMLRALLDALKEVAGSESPVHINGHVLDVATRILNEGRTKDSAYRHGQQLEILAAFLTEHRIVSVPLNWRCYLARPADRDRVGVEFDIRRRAMLPSTAAIDALALLYRTCTAAIDVAVTSIVAILASAPERINEVLRLGAKCEVWSKSPDGEKSYYGLQWPGSKGAEPQIKWVVDSMGELVRTSLERLRKISEPARSIARWYESNPNQLYLEPENEHLRGQPMLSMQQVGQVVFAHDVNYQVPLNWCKSNNLRLFKDGRKMFVTFADVEATVIKMLPEEFPWLDKAIGLKFSDALCLLRKNESHGKRCMYQGMFLPIAHVDVQSRLGSSKGHKSLFEAFDLTEADGSKIAVRTHQFRHFLNTLAHISGVSDVDIAKWSGRIDIRQNSAYDHQSSRDIVESIRTHLREDNLFSGVSVPVPLDAGALVERASFLRLKVPTAHTTEFGYCIHDFSMLPCQLHEDCLNCDEHYCIKGNRRHADNLRTERLELEYLVGNARSAVAEGVCGAEQWLQDHERTLKRVVVLCEMHDDPSLQNGTVIKPIGMRPPSHIQQAISDRARRLGVDGSGT